MGDLEIDIASQALRNRLASASYDDGETVRNGAYLQGQAADDFIAELNPRARRQLNSVWPTVVLIDDEMVYCLFCVSYWLKGVTMPELTMGQINASARYVLEHVRVCKRNDGAFVVVINDDAPSCIGEIFHYASGDLDRAHTRDLHAVSILNQLLVCETEDNALDNALGSAFILTNRACAEYIADAPDSRVDKLTELIRGVWDFASGTRLIAQDEVRYIFPRVVHALKCFL
jgi:hypothetical protein